MKNRALRFVLSNLGSWWLGAGVVLFGLATGTCAEGVFSPAGVVLRAWGTESGLPQNTVNSIAQTRDGYLWVGTREGLARFDGVRFTVFGLGEGLPSVEVQTLFVDHEGVLWIGSSGGGLSRLVNGRIETVTESHAPVASGVITALGEDETGCLWVGTLAGLRFWEKGAFVQRQALARLGKTSIRTLLRDHEGRMWIDTLAYGLFSFKNNELRPERGPPGNEKIVAYCLMEDRQGDLWASIGNGTLLCRRAGLWVKYDQSDGLPFAYITSLAQDAEGTVWAGSLDDGLYSFQAGRFRALRQREGLSANDIRSLCTDREGDLWVGTRTGGLNRLSRPKLIHCGVAEGLTNDFVRSVAEDRDGTLWVGTVGGGLYRGGLAGFRPFAPEPLIAFYASVDSVLVTRDGSLWWGGARALLRWKEGTLTGCFTNQSWISSAAVTALSADTGSGLWIGTSEGRLVHFENGGFVEFPRRVARGAITALAQQEDGYLWIGSAAGGLRRVRSGSDEVFSADAGLLSRSIRTLFLEPDGTLWIGTAGGGLSRWRAGKIATFTARQGLGADTVSQIVEDAHRCLWLGTSRGIFRVSKDSLEELASGRTGFLYPTAFGLNDGMPAEECSSGFCPAGLRTRAGLLCFSTVKGLVFLDPNRTGPRLPAPGALLEEIVVNGAVRMPGQPEPAGGPAVRHLSIGPGVREVEIHYTAISFAAPEKVRFRYRLEGMDSQWVEAGARRTAYYHRVPAGRFVFHVIACDARGVWGPEGTMLTIIVRPYLWEQGWFQFAAVGSLLAVVVWFLRLAEHRKYKRRLVRLETQHAIERERLRISQDMHDHIGGMLTQVSQLSDLGQSETAPSTAVRSRFEKIGGQARAAVQALDEIIWATNPKNDNLPRFAEYVSRFADEFFESTTVRCWQEMPSDLADLPLRADVRHNIFLAIREAFHNVVKHSGATSLWLRLGIKNSELYVEIEDDGQGFASERVAAGRNGLINMKARLAEVGGRTDVHSEPGKGTKVRFYAPLSVGA